MARMKQDVTLGGRYRLVERIASGGMGTVWRAQDAVLHRPVAVKILSDALGHDAKFVERFRREARAAAGLSHPNVAGVYDYGEDGEMPFMVMELIEGETLADRLHREGRLPPEEAARIAGKIADALQAAHDAGVIHRDVKPGNVMLTPRGEVKVMDFGIAAAAWAAPLTATGSTMGTASYLSPEQASGQRATPASDIYALGCVLYEMLTGRPPFIGDTPVAVAGAHIRDRPAPVRELAPEVPAHMATACERALAKEPSARPPSARVFAAMLVTEDLATVALEPEGEAGGEAASTTQVLPAPEPTARLSAPPAPAAVTPAAPPVAAPSPRPRRNRGLLVVIGLVLVMGLIAGLVAAFTGSGGPVPPKNKATKVEVPQVTGLPLDQAMQALSDAGLSVTEVKKVDGPKDVVVGIDPAEGTSLSSGDSVTLLVGKGQPKEDHGKDEDNGKHKGKGKGQD